MAILLQVDRVNGLSASGKAVSITLFSGERKWIPLVALENRDCINELIELKDKCLLLVADWFTNKEAWVKLNEWS